MHDHNSMPGMSGMHEMSGMPMCGSDMGPQAPAWLLAALGVWFALGALFYLYRICRPSMLRANYAGNYDPENEFSHGVCMAAMVTMVTPALLPISFGVWAWILGASALWFGVRTFSWGLKRPNNKWWWDATHVGMLGFMAIMFAGVTSPILSVLAACFWVYFTVYAAYYTYKLRRAGYDGGWLELGSDLAHITMGAAMFVMVIAPNWLM